MLSYKEYICTYIIYQDLLKENYSYGNNSFLELLLEAPIPNDTVNDIIKNNKQVSFYYQGDSKIKKSWYPVQVISFKKVGKKNIVEAYIVPKNEAKSYVHDFDQSKIINWSFSESIPASFVLNAGTSKKRQYIKEETTAEKVIANPTTNNINSVINSRKEMEPEFEKKVVSFMQNDSLPKEKKISLLKKLKNIGVKLSKSLLISAGLLYGGLKTPGIDHYIRKVYPNATQLLSPKNLTNKDFSQSQLKAIGHVIYNAIKRGERSSGGSTTYFDYPREYAEGIKKGSLLSNLSFVNKQITRDPYMMVSTTVGRFIFTRNNDGSYSINDPWDFSKSPTIKTTAKDLEGLTYPQKIYKIVKDNNTTTYSAVRHIAYLENPDNDKSFKAKKTILTIPKEYIVQDIKNLPYTYFYKTKKKLSSKNNIK